MNMLTDLMGKPQPNKPQPNKLFATQSEEVVVLNPQTALGLELLGRSEADTDGKHLTGAGALGGQAYLKGIAVGMEIVAVDGAPTQGMAREVLEKLLTDKSKTSVSVKLQRIDAIKEVPAPVTEVKEDAMEVASPLKTRSTELVHLACVIEEGFKDPDQVKEHEAGLGIQVNDDFEVIEMGHGQCKHRGVEKGFVVCGINGTAIQEMMEEQKLECNASNFGQIVTNLSKPFTLNFNGLPDCKSGVPTAFLTLMETGIECKKKHKNAFPFRTEGLRVIALNTEHTQIHIYKRSRSLLNLQGKLKETAVIKAEEILNIGWSKNRVEEVAIQTKGGEKDLVIKVGKGKVNQKFVAFLFDNFATQQAKQGNQIMGENPLSPNTYKRQSGTTEDANPKCPKKRRSLREIGANMLKELHTPLAS